MKQTEQENITLHSEKQDTPEGADLANEPAKKGSRIEYGSLDDGYIAAFCENPGAGKKAAILKAGYVGDFAAQEAYRLHNKLRERIEARLDEMVQEGAMLGYSTMLQICKEAKSDATRLKAAEDLMNYGGRKPGDTLTIKKERSDEELDEEIARLQREVQEQEGKRLN